MHKWQPKHGHQSLVSSLCTVDQLRHQCPLERDGRLVAAQTTLGANIVKLNINCLVLGVTPA